MKKIVIVLVSAALLVILSLLLWPRLRSSSHTSITGTPQFQITASDISRVSVKPMTIVKTGRKIAELDLVFSGSSFHKFAQEHLNQRVQFLVGTNLLVETQMSPVISRGELELSCSTVEEAQATADSLTNK